MLKKSRAAEEEHALTFGDDKTELIGYTMAEFANFLGKNLERPVLNQTGVEGKFDIVANVNLVSMQGRGGNDEDLPPTILGALQEMGLRLETRNGEIRRLVVDSAGKVPTGN